MNKMFKRVTIFSNFKLYFREFKEESIKSNIRLNKIEIYLL